MVIPEKRLLAKMKPGTQPHFRVIARMPAMRGTWTAQTSSLAKWCQLITSKKLANLKADNTASRCVCALKYFASYLLQIPSSKEQRSTSGKERNLTRQRGPTARSWTDGHTACSTGRIWAAPASNPPGMTWSAPSIASTQGRQPYCGYNIRYVYIYIILYYEYYILLIVVYALYFCIY